MIVHRILLWAALWVAGGALYVWLVRRGVNYIDRFAFTALFFLALSALSALPFRDLLAPRLREIGVWHLLGLAAAALVQAVAYATARRRLHPPALFIREHRHIYFLRMDYRYLVSKPFEVLFQQTLLSSLVLLLAGAGLSSRSIVLLCVLLFATVHLPLLWLVGRFFGVFYIVVAALAAAVFPPLILGVRGGIFYSYLAHWLFYTAAGLTFWVILDRRERATGAR